MFRFMPTATGFLHFGHVANILAIETLSGMMGAIDRNREMSFVIDDIQPRNWNLYDPETDAYQVDANAKTIRNEIMRLFPAMQDKGRFSDNDYISEAKKILIQCNNVAIFDRYKYYLPGNSFEVTHHGEKIFEVLKSYCKVSYRGHLYWNPFFIHSIVDKALKTSYQVVDYTLYHPERHLFDDHLHPFHYYDFWNRQVGCPGYNIVLIPRIVDENGESISKTIGDTSFSVNPVNTCRSRIEYAFDCRWDDIGHKILDYDPKKPYRIRRPE